MRQTTLLPKFKQIAAALAFSTLGLLSLTGTAQAQASDYPNRPIKWVVPYPPGGTTDVLARIVAQYLTEKLNQQVVVENKPGGNATIAASYVARMQPDGYTLFLTTNTSHSAAPWLMKNVSYDPVKDFTPIARGGNLPFILVINPKLPVKSVEELIAYAKANPNTLFFGSSGNGGADHLAGELFKMLTGAQITHVPYKGGAPALADLVAGRTQLQFMTIPASIGHIQSGRIRPLAILDKQRYPLFPNVPTISEAGVKNYDVNNWYGVVVAAGTPPAIVDKLNVALIKALRSEEVQARFSGLGLVPVSNSPKEFQQFIATESARWAEIIRVSGASLK